MAAVTINVLGRVSVCVDDVEHPVPGRRERSVLCVLITERGNDGSTDRLVDEVWSTAAAEPSRGSLQVAVSRLRAMLEPPHRPQGGTASVLVSRGRELRRGAAARPWATSTALPRRTRGRSTPTAGEASSPGSAGRSRGSVDCRIADRARASHPPGAISG